MTRREIVAKFRSQGLTYKQIVERTGFSRSSVNYHLNDKIRENMKATHNSRPILRLYSKVKRFNLRGVSCGRKLTAREVLRKFGMQTNCYLTGTLIDLEHDEYHFDHIVPVGKGGTNSIDNLGVASVRANMAKGMMDLNEFIELCRLVASHTDIAR